MLKLRGVKTIAVFEGLKAVFFLVAGFGLLLLVDRDPGAIAEQIVVWVHLGAGDRLSQFFVRSARDLNTSHAGALAGLALADALLRAIQAFGLWYECKWAMWLGVVSGGMFLPVEIYELSRGINWWKLTALVINVVIVAYLIWALQRVRSRKENENGVASRG